MFSDDGPLPSRLALQVDGSVGLALWDLHGRAEEARRPDSLLRDAKALGIREALGIDLHALFGTPGLAEVHHAAAVDREVDAFLTRHPDGTVVSLGEALETRRFRVHRQPARWIVVDRPELIRLREAFIAPDARHLHVPADVPSRSWMPLVPRDRPALITARGALWPSPEPEVADLLASLARFAPGATVVFDTVPPWFARRARRGWGPTDRFVVPEVGWATTDPAADLRRWVPGATVTALDAPAGLGRWASEGLARLGLRADPPTRLWRAVLP